MLIGVCSMHGMETPSMFLEVMLRDILEMDDRNQPCKRPSRDFKIPPLGLRSLISSQEHFSRNTTLGRGSYCT